MLAKPSKDKSSKRTRIFDQPKPENPTFPMLESLLPARRGAIFPVEILTIIFYMVVESYSQYYTPDLRILHEEAQTIRSASQVCQLWRHVSFNCHNIWGTILNVDSSSTLWITELLHRSGSAPLVVQSAPTKKPKIRRCFDSPKWKLILAQTHRFRKLDLTLGNRDIHTLLSIFLQPAPLLEILILKHDQGNGSYRSVDVSFSLPKGLFAGVTPKLRTFTLEKVLFRWFPVDRVVQDIVRLDLTLSEKDMLFFSFDYRPLAKMALPNLQELVLTGTGRCSRFLSFLAIPSSCMTTLSFTQRDLDSSLAGDPLLWVEDYLRGWQARQPPVHYWYLSTSQSGAFAFHAGTKGDSLNRPHFVLEYNGRDAAGIRLVHLLDFLLRESILHESAIMTLDFQASLDVTDGLAGALAALLSQCTRVETLTLLGTSMENIIAPVLIQYPEATTHLRHLIIDGPYPASVTSILSVKALLTQYALQPLRNGGEKLQQITVCVDDSRKLKCLGKGVVDFAKIVNYLPLRPRVVHRGELDPKGWWSLGPCP